MKVTKYDNEEDWMNARSVKITGSKLKDIYSSRGTKKIGYYQLIADRISIQSDGEDARDRGHRLEKDAIEAFEKKTGKKVNTDLVIWTHDDIEIALSPDGSIGEKEAVEAKCLSSARHIETHLTQNIPDDFDKQKIQYFIVNEKLETLYFVFHDPLTPSIETFIIEVKREDIKDDIEKYYQFQKDTIEEINKVVSELTF